MVSVQKEIPLWTSECYLWTDSETVLKFIKNETKRLQRFVSNRISYIRERTKVHQWRFMPGHLNPAYIVSRGLSAREFMISKVGKKGTDFLHHGENFWPQKNTSTELDYFDPDIKRSPKICVSTAIRTDVVRQLFESISDWTVLRQTVLGFLKFKAKLLGRPVQVKLCLDDLHEAERGIIFFEQAKNFGTELSLIKNSRPLMKKSTLKKFSQFLDKKSVVFFELAGD